MAQASAGSHFSIPVHIGRLSKTLALVTDIHGGRRALMSARAVCTLLAYQKPAFLANNPSAVATVTTGEASNRSRSGVIDDVATLVRDGWLVPECEWLTRAQRPAHELLDTRALRQEKSIVVLTDSRPDLLGRCLESISTTYGSTNGLTVTTMDDCRQNDDARAIATSVNRTRAHPMAARYAGHVEKLAAVRALAETAGLDQAILASAFIGDRTIGSTFGANLNAAVCDAVGNRLVFCDDDIVWAVRGAPWKEDGVLLGGESPDPTEMSLFESLRAAESVALPESQSVIELHERYLCRRVMEVVDGASHVRVGSLGHSLFGAILNGTGRIAVSVLGIYGDCGLWSPQTYLHLAGQSRARLAAAKNYRPLYRSRQILRASKQATISESGWLMAGAMAIDTDAIIPPFLPVLRNAEGLFGVMLRMIDNAAYTCCLPFVVSHRPPPREPFTADAIWSDASKVRLSEHIAMALNHWPMRAGVDSPAERLDALGAWLSHLAARPGSLDECLREGFERMARLRIASALKHLEEEPDGSTEWRGDLKAQMAVLLRALQEKWSHLPSDVDPADADVRARLARTASVINEFGELTSAWPRVLDACRIRRQEFGSAISVPV